MNTRTRWGVGTGVALLAAAAGLQFVGAFDADGRPPRPGPNDIKKPDLADATLANIYADNWFVLYLNGQLVAVDSIDFLPHNVVSVDVLPSYPLDIAVLAKDNADPQTGCEYGRRIGDGGFILKLSDGTATNATWKAKAYHHGPINRDTNTPQVANTPIPDRWYARDFDDSTWDTATAYTETRINPKKPFYDHDFEGARWIWTSDLDLDNTVVLRTRVEQPGWQPTWTTRPDLVTTDVPGLQP